MACSWRLEIAKFTDTCDHATTRKSAKRLHCFDAHISATMSSTTPLPVPNERVSGRLQKCSGCGLVGHNRRRCPVNPGSAPRRPTQDRVTIVNAVEKGPQPPPIVTTVVEDVSSINWEKVLYVVFDLETTGRSRQRDEIIEIAAQVLDPFGIQLEDAIFSNLIKPNSTIPPFITELTTITNEDVSSSEKFSTVAGAFIRFMREQADEYSLVPIEHVILVGHNGKAFDIPFFIQQLSAHQMVDRFFEDARFGLAIDTLQIARKAIKNNLSVGSPSAFNLSALFQFVTGMTPQISHRATADVKATISVFRYDLFWKTRQECVFSFGRCEDATRGVPDDSDTSVSTDIQSLSSNSDDNDEEDNASPLGDHWEVNKNYRPSVPIPSVQFKQHFTSSSRSRRNKTGLQCSPIDVNTPMRAWREIFKNTLLDKIVRYTNEYGHVSAKRWVDVTRKDLESFIAILFISAVQKRKDKPANWFSNHRILESQVMKKIMSGRRFFTMLRYLHCCSMEPPPVGSEYDPSYKIFEVQQYLEERFNRLYIPGEHLSLDETLIRAFGRMKFKVRIVTKAARYGIKLYVITDAATAFVLKVIVYTGSSTYDTADQQEEKKKTVQIVERLVEPFVGTFRTIYVDRFYTSLDLLKMLEEKDLFITGTMLANRIPQNLRIPKTSATFKSMKRGDSVKCRVSFKTKSGGTSYAGLVCWRDRNMVYCLSNDTNNFESDVCRRRGQGGIISIPRPVSIAEYNKYMGGVDLADMRRLHCNSTIMCQNRWWLKLFFYLLDVGTSNALVLYNESCSIRLPPNTYKPMNIVEFKMTLVEGLVGKTIEELFNDGVTDVPHSAVHIEGNLRSRCAFCALLSRQQRTRYKCLSCGVPLCSIGNGKVEDDCFSKAHESEEVQRLVCVKYEEMQKRTTNKNKNST